VAIAASSSIWTSSQYHPELLARYSEPTGVERLFDPTANVQPARPDRQTAYEHIDIIPVTAILARQDLSRASNGRNIGSTQPLPTPLPKLLSDYDYLFSTAPAAKMSLAELRRIVCLRFLVISLGDRWWHADSPATVSGTFYRASGSSQSPFEVLGYVVSKFTSVYPTFLTHVPHPNPENLRQRSLSDRHPRPSANFGRGRSMRHSHYAPYPLPMAQTSPSQFFDEFAARMPRTRGSRRPSEALSALTSRTQLALGEKRPRTPPGRGAVPCETRIVYGSRLILSLIRFKPRALFDEEC